LTVAVAAITVTAATGVFLHFHPGPNAIDRLGFTLLPSSTHSSFFRIVTWFGTAAALVIGSVSAATVAWFSAPRRRGRTLACLLGPPSAAAVNQFLIKPQVGRLYIGELSFVSGSVIVIAGVSAAWVLAAPRRLRPILSVLGFLGVVLMSVAVVVLRWHYPIDALVGALFAVGMVMMVDGATRLYPGGRRYRPSLASARHRAKHRWWSEPGGIVR
jgi:membrane-associated phospholipid phosphatase